MHSGTIGNKPKEGSETPDKGKEDVNKLMRGFNESSKRSNVLPRKKPVFIRLNAVETHAFPPEFKSAEEYHASILEEVRKLDEKRLKTEIKLWEKYSIPISEPFSQEKLSQENKEPLKIKEDTGKDLPTKKPTFIRLNAVETPSFP